MSDNSPYPNYFIDSCIPRNSLDRKHPNKSGKLLTDLCKETGLRILNGRTLGDLRGKYTCITYNGCSVVDYTLVSSSPLQGKRSFMVNNLTPISDHFPISCSILACFDDKTNKNKEKIELGGYGFLFRSEIFFRTTQELEYLFFLSRKSVKFFFQNLTLGYMIKTLNQIIFYSPPKSEYFFQQHWESE